MSGAEPSHDANSAPAGKRSSRARGKRVDHPGARRWEEIVPGTVPFLLVIAAWALLPHVIQYPPYMLPSIGVVFDFARESIADGSLLRNVAASLGRLAIGFAVGMALAIPLGLAVALNRQVSDLFRPVLSFLQAIAGIAWVPLTIVWFGVGNGSVIFIIANTIFFASLYNTVIGVQTIPNALYRAVQSHGGRGIALLTNLILPGALVQILLGIRTSMAYGWRALVASEMIAGSNGLGYMTMEAVQWQRTETIILGMIVIGLLWVLMDRFIFTTLERRTVQRWGMLQR